MDHGSVGLVPRIYGVRDYVEADPAAKKPLHTKEAYSVAGEIGFGWWLVEHYLPYHVDCPDGCGLGEPTRGR